MRVETSRAARTRHTGLGFGAALLTGVLVFLLVTIVSGMAFVLSPGGASTVAATFLKAQPGSIRWDEHSRLNVLLIGTDGASASAASMMIVSFAPPGRSVTILSIPTNLWVTVPGSGQAQIGDAYSIGGPSLALETTESITHVVVPYFAVMSTGTISRWIDAFGGVRVHVDVPLGRDSAGKFALTPGTKHLNGAQALTFARATSPYDTGSTDSLRRQQSLFVALMRHDVSPQDLIRLPQIVSSLGGSIRTNFPYDQVPDLAHFLTLVPRSGTAGDSIGAHNGTASSYLTTGRAVLLPDRQRIRTLAQRMFPDHALHTRGQITVLNGSGVSGQAGVLATWLSQSRVSIGIVSSAPSYNVAHTQVWVSADVSGTRLALARSIGELLQIPVTTHTMTGVHARVAVVIGQDFVDPTQQ